MKLFIYINLELNKISSKCYLILEIKKQHRSEDEDILIEEPVLCIVKISQRHGLDKSES